ncbi:MAG: Fe-S protein assembly co-chaperone HscB [Polyangiaceae bacterium]|nr:Fe-S protein assembly co-chaperone HscB [Polyangiaceae bacterium]
MLADPFATLGAPYRFDLDLPAIEKVHRELSRALHPDRFAQAGASERRAALEKAATVNEAWRVVRDPVRRAEALLAIGGIAVGENREPQASPALLMDVLEHREALADARAKNDMVKIRALRSAFEARERSAEEKLTQGFALAFAATQSSPWRERREALEAILPALGELRFFKRLLGDVSAIEEEQA